MLDRYINTWLAVDLMGHQRFVGRVIAQDGLVTILESPLVEGDEDYAEAPRQEWIVNLGAPSLHHAEAVTEEHGLVWAASRRARIWKPRPALESRDDVDDADEVVSDDDSEDDEASW